MRTSWYDEYAIWKIRKIGASLQSNNERDVMDDQDGKNGRYGKTTDTGRRPIREERPIREDDQDGKTTKTDRRADVLTGRRDVREERDVREDVLSGKREDVMNWKT